MGSQTDYDQGGTPRQFVRRWLGPSVGWVNSPDSNQVGILSAGTTSVVIGTTLVKVAVAGLVTVQLPKTLIPAVPAGVLPGDYLYLPMTIGDFGGYAGNPSAYITILPFAGERIDGLTSLTISSFYGSYTIIPKFSGGWVQQ